MTRYVVIRCAADSPAGFPPGFQEGRWYDLDQLYPDADWTLPMVGAVGVPTGRWERRDDGAHAQVYEVRQGTAAAHTAAFAARILQSLPLGCAGHDEGATCDRCRTVIVLRQLTRSAAASWKRADDGCWQHQPDDPQFSAGCAGCAVDHPCPDALRYAQQRTEAETDLTALGQLQGVRR